MLEKMDTVFEITDEERLVLQYCEQRISEMKEEKAALTAASKSISHDIRRYLKMVEDIRQGTLPL